MAERQRRDRASAALDRLEAREDADALRRVHPRVRRIVGLFCRALAVRPSHVLGARRTAKVVLARQAVMYWVRRRFTWSYSRIGRRFGDRDHTTVLHGVRAYRAKRLSQGRTLKEARWTASRRLTTRSRITWVSP
ncbi:MAG: helix-turn-helix domain-containing protein, partial [Bradyrhizobium sp.]